MHGLEGSDPQGLTIELEAVPERIQHALGVEFLDERFYDQSLKATAVQRTRGYREFLLRRCQKGINPSWEQHLPDSPAHTRRNLPAALVEMRMLDPCLKGTFVRQFAYLATPSTNRARSRRSIS